MFALHRTQCNNFRPLTGGKRCELTLNNFRPPIGGKREKFILVWSIFVISSEQFPFAYRREGRAVDIGLVNIVISTVKVSFDPLMVLEDNDIIYLISSISYCMS